MRRIIRRFWLGVFVAGVLSAVFTAPRAQPAPGEDAAVVAADMALGAAMRAGDKSMARRLLSLEFTYTDENGQIHERKAFLADIKSVAPAAATDVNVKIYGLVATVTGKRRSAQGNDAFFLDVWAKDKRAWRALAMQDVVLAAADAPAAEPEAAAAPANSGDCKNPCQTIPYRVRSSAEQDVVTTLQAIEKAGFAHDADDWGKYVADEFVQYRSDRAPIAKPQRIAVMADQKERNLPAVPSAIQSMRLAVYGDGAAMISTESAPDGAEPTWRDARVWVRRNGRWQMAISVQTAIR